MPIVMNCPECGESYTLADRQLGKKVRCKQCEHVFVVEEQPRGGKRGSGSNIQAGHGPRLAAAPVKPRLTGKGRDEEEEDEGDEPRRKPAKGGSGKLILILGLFLFALAAGGVGVWLILRDDDKTEDTKADATDGKSPQGAFGNQDKGGGVDPFKDKVPDGGGAPPVDLAESAKTAPTETLLEQLKDTTDLSKVRQPAMRELAKRKELRAAPDMARLLTNFFDREVATSSLRQLGAGAEKDVLTYMNHPDNGVRERARGLLRDYETKDDTLCGQAVKDLMDGDRNRQRAALEWLEPVRPVPEKAVEVATAVQHMLDEQNLRELAMKVLVKWGSKDNAVAISKVLLETASNPFIGDLQRKGFEALARYKDPRGAEALCRYLGHNFGGGDAAEKELREFGPAAEVEVAKMSFDPNNVVRDRVKRLLDGYNTKETVIVPQAAKALASTDSNCRKAAAEWLGRVKQPVPEYQADVAKGLDTMLKDNGWGVREVAIKALTVWATKENLAALIQLLADKNFRQRLEVIEAVGRIKDARAALVVSSQLFVPEAAATASKVLKEMGPVAEPAVLPGLNHMHPLIRAEACNILAVIGTEASIEPLKKRSTIERNLAVKAVVKQALAAVMERTGKEPPKKDEPKKDAPKDGKDPK